MSPAAPLTLRAALLVVCLLATAPTPALFAGQDRTGAAAQAEGREPGPSDVTIRATRLDRPLVLDGRLDEATYASVAPVTRFIQQEPRYGSPATERTELWILYDDRTL